MKVITLDKTKELLGITDTSQDAAITAKIPFIDAKVKQITNNRFNFMVVGDITLDSPYVPIYSIITYNRIRYDYDIHTRRFYRSGINNPMYFDDIGDFLETGQQLEGEGIPAETYIEEVYYNGDILTDISDDFDVPTIKMSANATETTEDLRIYLGINIAYQPIIAKGVQYLIDSTNAILPSNGISSKSIGPVSVSYASTSQTLDNKYGMPSWFVKAFPIYQRGH